MMAAGIKIKSLHFLSDAPAGVRPWDIFNKTLNGVVDGVPRNFRFLAADLNGDGLDDFCLVRRAWVEGSDWDTDGWVGVRAYLSEPDL